ncbi:MAG TPA: hypothetical protein PLF73_03385 [Luteimonas sp.]|nr:hypothetical protein [Luteimonas sp.]
MLACLWLAPMTVLALDPSARMPVAAQAVESGAEGLGHAMADDELLRLRGGDAMVLVSVDNQGEVSGNTAVDVVSGNNRIDGGAFANATGLTTVIQNSGANVLIQNGTAINIRFGDPGL